MDSKENKNQNDSAQSEFNRESLMQEANERRRETVSKNNRLWLWLGILVLVAILLYALFSMGLFESMSAASGN